MKKSFYFLVIFLLATTLSTTYVSAETTNSYNVEPKDESLGFNDEQIIRKLEQISKDYEVGDKLSLKDAEFIKKYANTPKKSGDNQLLRTKSIYGEDSNGVHDGYTSGSISASTGFTWGKFSGDFTTYDTSNWIPTRIKNSLTHTAYGHAGGNSRGF